MNYLHSILKTSVHVCWNVRVFELLYGGEDLVCARHSLAKMFLNVHVFADRRVEVLDANFREGELSDVLDFEKLAAEVVQEAVVDTRPPQLRLVNLRVIAEDSGPGAEDKRYLRYLGDALE